MGKNDARRQKQLAKKKAKREDKRAQLARQTSKDPTVRLAGAAAWPFIDAFVADTIWTNGIGSVVVSRQMPGGMIAVASFMVDIYCLGVKNAYWHAMSSFEYREFVAKNRRNSPASNETPEYAFKLIQTAVEYARCFGFAPHPDYRHARLLFAGVDPEKCTETFTMGRDGKPFYVRGPHESLAQARSIANRVHNAGGNYLIPLKGGEVDVPADDDFDSNDIGADPTSRGMRLPWPDAPNPRMQAQDLAFDANEADTDAEAVRLARRAIALDPDCVEALEILARLTNTTTNERLTALEAAVAAGERSLGADFFERNKGHFWGMLETRPYMRVRESLARALFDAGRTADAIRHLEAMLELNPNDNQGNRDLLRGCYLLIGDLEGVRRLHETYPDTHFAAANWSRVLERHLAGAPDEAASAYALATSKNPHVEAYLTGREPMPSELPDVYSLGSVAEAIVCADFLGPAWRKHQDALEWLKRAGNPGS